MSFRDPMKRQQAMFDPPQKHWKNQSLLSLMDGKDSGKSLLAQGPVEYRPLRPSAPERTEAPAEKPERPARLRSLFGRMKKRLIVVPAEESAKPRLADSEAGVDTGRRSPAEHPRHQEEEISRVADRAPQTYAPPEEDIYWRPVIDPMRIFSGILWARRLIIATTVLGAVAGVLIALATPKQYYAATEILFDPRRLQLSDRDLTSDNLPSDATLALIENQVSIIASAPVLNRVVERLELAADPEFNGQGDSFLGTLFNPRALLSLGGNGGATQETRWTLAVQNLAEKLNVSRNERTFIIHVGVSTEEAEKSALVANTVAEVYLAQAGDMQQQTANRATTELTGRLDELQAQVQAAERAVADFKVEHDLVDAQGRLITDDEIVRLNDQLSTARARTSELNARAASARDLQVDDVLGGALPEQVSSPVMTELLAQYAGLNQQADRAAVRLGPRHPEYLAVQAELGGVRDAIAGELRRVIASIQVELQRAVQLEQELAARLARLKVEKGSIESEQVTLRELEREAAARRAVYESFLLRARETGQQSTLNTANANIISAAYPPLLPSGPSRASIAMVGTVLGFLAGVAIGATKGAMDSLRENMNSPRPTSPRPSSGRIYSDAAGMRRRREDDFPEEDDGDLDPPPSGPDPRDRRHHGNEAAPAAAGTEPTSLERIRDDLRAVRHEIDTLARQRAIRRA